MSDEPRPGSRSERHMPRRDRRARRASAVPPLPAVTQGTPPQPALPPVIEALRPQPPRSARRAEQRIDRRRRRGRIIAAVVVLIALISAGVAFSVLRPRDKSKPPGPDVNARSQRTLLVQIPSPDGDARASALLVTDPASGNGALVLVPSRMLSQVPGYGSAVFGDALALGGPQLSLDTLANQLGITVDRTWLLSPADLAAIVDAVGGVEVTVDVDLPGGKESNDVVLRQGLQHLAGAAAAAFATYGVPSDPELGRLNRFQLVLVAIMDKLPKTKGDITGLLPATRPAASGARREDLAETLRLIAAARAAQKLDFKAVPVTDIDNGSDEETTRVDPPQLAALLTADLAGSIPPNEFRPHNQLVIHNGVGTAGVGQSVTRRLNAAGFVVVQSGNADNFDYKTTEVTIFDSGDESVRRGEAVAAALGVPLDSVEVSDLEQTVADVIVTVGADYSETSPRTSVGP